MEDPALKTLLAAGKALLKPPDPLPSAPQLLLERLRESSALLPWSDRAGWTEDDELDEIGDDDADDRGKRKARRDQLVLLVGQRCLDLVVAIQAFLGKEFWPAEYRQGLKETDFLLGTADLRLLRLMLQHTVVSYLLPLTLAYVTGLPSHSPPDPRLPAALDALLSLTETPSSPSPTSSGSSTRHELPLTQVSQTVTASHLPAIVLATITVAWTPTESGAVHAALRSHLMQVIGTLSPTQAMATLSTALKIVQGGKRKPPRGWSRTWPQYVENTISTQLSAQVLKPGGVKAVMENIFGEAGNIAGPEAIDGPKLDQISGLLSRVPKTTTPESYIPYLLSTLFELIAPESASHPLVYTHTAAYVVHHLWSTSFIAKQWLEQRLHAPWLPRFPHAGVVVPATDISSTARTAAQLVLHAPPSPGFTEFVVRPILPPLFALHAALSPVLSAKSVEKQAEAASGLEHDVKLLLTSWGKIVSKEDGVRGVWSIIRGGRGWPVSEHGDVLQWQKCPDGMELVPVVDMPNDSMDVDDDNLLDQINLEPNPQLLAGLLKDLARFDVATEVFLKVLDEWRVRAHSDEEPLQTLLYLRLAMAMMETLDQSKLFSNPTHILTFVEGVLQDEVKTLPSTKPLVQEVDDTQLPELTAEGVQSLGMVETAISLLLASLEANEQINHATAAILHPINAHLETLSEKGAPQVRNLAREALLVLMIRRSASLSTSEPTQEITTYRRALNLIADPVLPVRAHGLILLRDLVLSPSYDPALTPAILEVYTQAIQDPESYIYLNAVNGLAAMASHLGKDIFRTLVRQYRESSMDKSLRLGEALGLVIKRSGEAFAANADVVVPTLLSMFPDTALPTIQRVSALSLLSIAAESHLALLPWSEGLASAAIDLIQVESVTQEVEPAPQPPEPRKLVRLVDDDEPEEEERASPPRVVDAEPTALDSKHPALRCAAVVFLGLLVASIVDAEDAEPDKVDTEFTLRMPGDAAKAPPPRFIDDETLRRADAVLGYVSGTDVDPVVRGQAGEVVTLIHRLRETHTLRSVPI